MIRALLVDDELNARESLRLLVEQSATPVEIVGTASSVDEAYDKVKELRPDLVFLDVEMPKANGFELLERFSEIPFKVIFTTAHGHYAIKAIRFSAIDYLLKPVDLDELDEALGRLENMLIQTDQDYSENIKVLIENLSSSGTKKIAIPDLEGITFVNMDDVIRCEADRNYTSIYLQDGRKLLSSKVLKEYERLFSEHHFIRLHNSHIINLRHVKRYIKGEGGTVIMSDDSAVDVSRRRKAEFLERLNDL